MQVRKQLILILTLLLFVPAFAQHLVYNGNDALNGTGAPAYGYGQFFSTWNNYLYVTNGDRIVMFNVTNPADPVFNYNFTGGIYIKQRIEGNLSYIAANTNGIRDYNINLANGRPSLAGTLPSANDAKDFVKVGSYLYVARDFYGLGTVNVTTHASPTLLNTYNDGTSGWTSVGGNTNVIAATSTGGVKLFTRTNPSLPVLAGTITASSPPSQLYVSSGDILYFMVTAGADTGVSFYNVANPASPTLLGRISTSVTTYHVDGNYIYLAANRGGNVGRIYTYDVSNMSSPVIIDSVSQNLGQFISVHRDTTNHVMYAERWDGAARDLVTYQILGSVTLNTPNGLDTLYRGDSVDVSWTGIRTPGLARIELNRNYPNGTWEYINDVPFSDGSYRWGITGATSTNARFRVRSLIYSSIVSDESNNNFSILDRAIMYSSPTVGSTIYIGDNDTIRWNHVGLTGNVTVEFNNTYPTGTWTTIGTAPAISRNFVWTVTGVNSTTARYRVSSVAYPTLRDTTDGNLTVSSRTITVVSPNGVSTFWFIRDTVNVTWTSANVTGMVEVELNRSYPTGTWTSLGQADVAAGSKQVVVTGPYAATSRVRVRSLTYPVATDISDGNFYITNRILTLDHPVGGEVLNVLSNDTIRWTFSDAGSSIRIELNRDYPNGTWELLGTPGIASRQFVWNVTAPVTSTARIRITSGNYSWVTSSSASNFTIRANPSVYVTPTVLAFPDVPVNTTSAIQTVAMASRSRLQIKAMTFTHTNSRYLVTLQNADSTANNTDSLRFRVSFSPDSINNIADTLRVTFNAPYASVNIPISGNGSGAYFRVSPTTVTFASTEAGDNVTQTVTLYNDGNITLSPVAVTGTGTEWGCTLGNTSIAPFSSITATVRFTPQAAGARSNTFHIAAPGLNANNVDLPASGTGITTPVAPASLNVTTTGENANLNWSAVTQSVNGFPIVVERYLVFFNASSPYNADAFYFLNYTTGALASTHTGVVRHSTSMNYNVRAYIGNTDSFDRVIRQLPKNVTATEVMRRLSENGGALSTPLNQHR